MHPILNHGLFWARLVVAITAVHATTAAEPPSQYVLQEQGASVTALVFNRGGQLLASGSTNGVVTIWNSLSNNLLCNLPAHTGKVSALTFSQNANFIASGGEDHRISVWTVAGAKLLRTLDGHASAVSALAFTPDGSALVSGGADGTLFVWNTRNWAIKDRLCSHPSCVRALRVSSNSEFLASGSDELLRIWDLAGGTNSFGTFQEPVRAISFHELNVNSPGDQKPKFDSSDGRGTQLWQPSGAIGKHIIGPWRDNIGVRFSRSQKTPTAVAIEGSLMASGGPSGTVEIWDSASYDSLGKFDCARIVAHHGGVNCLAFSPGGFTLASGGDDGAIKVWPAGMLLKQARAAESGE